MVIKTIMICNTMTIDKMNMDSTMEVIIIILLYDIQYIMIGIYD
jgi:hypothetical protein